MVIKLKQIEEMKRLKDEKLSFKQIGKQLKISPTTVRKYLLKDVEGKGVDKDGSDEGTDKSDRTLYSEVFTAFDHRKSLIEVVKDGLCSPIEAEELWRRYNDLKMKALEVKEIQNSIQQPTLITQHERMIKDIEKEITHIKQRLDDLTNIMMDSVFPLILKERPKWMKTNCKHYKDEICKGINLNKEPEECMFHLKTTKIKDKWYIDPDPRVCALCPMNTLSRE